MNAKVNPFAKYIPQGGAASNPANKAVIEQAVQNEDVAIAQERTSPAPAPATNPNVLGDVEAFNRGTGMLSSVQPGGQTELTFEEFDRLFMMIPGMPAFSEYAQQMNMNAADAIDFLGPDIINAVLAANDIQADVSAGGALESLTGGQQDFMPDGTGKTAAKTAADFSAISLGMSAMLKKLPSMLPSWAAAEGGTKQIGVGIADEVGKASNVMLDTIYGAAGGIGDVYGKEVDEVYGGFVGSLAAPMSLGASGNIIKNMLAKGGNELKKGVSEITAVTDRFNTGEAEKLIARQLYNEGITPDQALQMYKDLGDDAMLADLGGNFRALLEQATTVFPRIYTNAQHAFAERMKDQPARMMKAFNDITGTSMLDADTEVQRLATQFEPGIKALYQQTRDRGMQLSPKMQTFIKSSPSLQKYSKMAVDAMADDRASGNTVSTIDYVDYMKKFMDDDIQDLMKANKKANKVSQLTKLKNNLVAEADIAIPEYKQARESFASFAELKNAASVGANIFKLSEEPGVFKATIEGMNAPEKRMAVLGMKEAMISKFNRGAETANSVNQMFKQRGTLDKARVLFPDDKSFAQFKEAMRREMEYVATHNQAIGGPATARRNVQAMIGQKDEAMINLLEKMDNKKSWQKFIKDKIFNMWAKKANGQLEALETAGDLMMLKGMEASRVEKILKTEDPFKIQEILLDSLEFYSPGLGEKTKQVIPTMIPETLEIVEE
jgi:hypothetical protein